MQKLERVYLSIDPGVVTGLACLFVYDGGMDHDSWEEPDMQRVAFEVRSAIRIAKRKGVPFVGVTEKFRISQRTIKTKIFYDSLYLNGWVSIEYPGQFIEQPTSAKDGRVRTMMANIGWANPTPDDHADDASCHLLTRAVYNKEPLVLAALGRSAR